MHTERVLRTHHPATEAMVNQSATSAVRVVIVDDYPPFLGMARDLVNRTPGFVSAGELASGREACARIDADEPALALIDVHMSDMDGIAVARWIRRHHGEVVVVLISADDPAVLPAAAYECDAAAVVRKQDLRPSLLRDLWQRYGPIATD
ncbi:MAG: response regulator [Nocardioidaceae bacterium]